MASYFRVNIAGDLSGNLPMPTVTKIQGTPVSSTAPTANQILSFVGSNWLPSSTPAITNVIDGYSTTVTSGGTTTLTYLSNQQQYFTGTSAQTVTLPQTSTLTLGERYLIVNNSSANISVETFGSAAVATVLAGTSLPFTCTDTSNDAASSWSYTTSAAGTVSGLTAKSFVYGSSSGTLVSTANPTNGQLLIGSTGNIPVVATLTSGSGISIANGAGSITITNTGVTSFQTSLSGLTPSSSSTGAITLAGTLGTTSGGTGTTVAPTAGQLPVGVTGGTYTPFTVTTGTGISTTTGSGTFQINNTGVTSAIAGTGISVSGSTGSVTVTNTGVTSLSGTSNQVTASASTGSVTLSTPSTFIAPGTIQDTSGMLFSTSASVTAAGTTQGTATALTKSYNVITTAAASSGVALPTPSAAGLIVVVVNKGANALNVYPASGGAIDAAGSNTAVTLQSGSTATYQASSTTQWYTVRVPIIAGSGTSVTYGNGSTTVANTGVTSFQTSLSGLTPSSSSTGAVTLAGTLGISSGGTALTATPSNGQLPIGNGTNYTLSTLTQGTGITITNGSGSITVANSGVTSFSAGTTGLLPSSATTGAVTLSGTLGVSNGGTGQTTFGAGALLLGNGTSAISSLADVATGSVLTSGGVGSNPTWTAFTSDPTASTVMSRDSSGSTAVVNLIEGYSTTATAAGTTTLTVASNEQQYFTGSTTQTVLLPDTTTLVNGQSYQLVNNSTGTLTVQTSGASAVSSVPPSSYVTFVCTDNSTDASGSWSFTPGLVGTQGTSLTLSGLTANSFLYSGTSGLLTTTAAPTNGQILIGSTGSAPAKGSISGTSNQITVTNGAGSITLSLPSAVTINSSLTVSGLTANSFLYSGTSGLLTTPAAPTDGQLLIGSTGSAPAVAALTAGTGISIANGAGSITVSNAATFSTGTTGLSNVGTNTAVVLSGVLEVDNGGTGATSTTMGGIVYGASSTAYGTSSAGTLNNLLVSGGTGAPTWSTGITFDSATPTFTGIGTPVNASDAANKAYVDAAITGFSVHEAVDVATTANLTATYNNGTAGVGATLTNSGTQVALAIDGVSLSVGDRVLVKNQSTQTENGIYQVTTVGSGSTNWVLTRTSDYDNSIAGEVRAGGFVFVAQGTAQAATGWIQINEGTGPSESIAIGTDNIAFTQFSGVGTYTAGTGLSLSGTQFSNTGVLSLTGTGNQITASASTGNVTLSLPSAVTISSSLTVSGQTANSFLYSGTGGLLTTTAAPTNGQLLIGSTGNAPVKATLTAGTGISVANGAGSITVSNIGVTSITGTANQITASASTGAVTLSLPSAVTIGTSLTVSGQTANSFLYSGTAGLLTTTAAPTNGQLLIGSTGSAPVAAALTQGTGITITNGAGSITVANAGVTALAAGTGISVSGSTGSVTISNTATFSTGTTGLSNTGTNTAVTLAGTLVVSNGGTGQTTFGAGSLLLGNGTSAIASLADVATGSVLSSGGVGSNPTWKAFTSAATASTVMSRDSSGSTTVVNLIEGYSTTATAAGTTTLTVASNEQQYFTGTTTQTVKLPVTTTLVNGQSYQLVNNSTGTLSIQTGGASAITTVPGGSWVKFVCVDNSSDVAASWSYTASVVGTSGTTLTLSGLTANSFLYSGTSGLLTTTAAPTNGQILIGATGAAPVKVSLNGDVTMANSTGAVTVVAVDSLPISATTGSNSSIFFGYSSTLPSATESVGIGYQALDVATGAQNTALGVTAGSAISSGTGNTVLGYGAGTSVSTANNNTIIGSGADSSVAGAVALGQGITANQAGGFFVTHRGPISVLTNTAGFIAGTNELVELTSSIRYKQNVRDLEDVSSRFDMLRPVRFQAKPGYGEVGIDHIGLIAEEVEELFPEFVTHDTEGLTTGMMYDRMISVLIKEIQSLKKMVVALTSAQ